MKKILVFICCLMMVVCFAACGETQEAVTETEPATDTQTTAANPSFDPLAFDAQVLTQIFQAESGLKLLFDEIDGMSDGFDISEVAMQRSNEINQYGANLLEIECPADDIFAAEYINAAVRYIGYTGMGSTYVGLKGLESTGYGISNPTTAANFDAESLANMQEIIDTEGHIEDLAISHQDLINSRMAFLMSCGAFSDLDEIGEYLNEYPYPAEY